MDETTLAALGAQRASLLARADELLEAGLEEARRLQDAGELKVATAARLLGIHRQTLYYKLGDVDRRRPDCVEWEGGRTGRYGADCGEYAHRRAWERAHGPIPEGAAIHHTCGYPLCVNPDHLRLYLSQSGHVTDHNAARRTPLDTPTGGV